MNDLVKLLAEGDHPVIVGGSQRTLANFSQRLQEMGYVFIKFTDTRGGTDLGVRVDREASDWTAADFDAASGVAHVEGMLTLDYVKVRCIADIDLSSLSGMGHLVVLEDATVG